MNNERNEVTGVNEHGVRKTHVRCAAWFAVGVVSVTILGAVKPPLFPVEVKILQDQVRKLESRVAVLEDRAKRPPEVERVDIDLIRARLALLEGNKKPAKE